MNDDKFESAVEALTSAVAEDKPASDALQLLLADYYMTKAELEDLSRKLTVVTHDRTLAGVFAETNRQRTNAITRLKEVSAEDIQILQNLVAAQQDIKVAKSTMDKYLEEYRKLEGNVGQLKSSMKGLAGGLIKSVLGPAAELGPVKSFADKLFS